MSTTNWGLPPLPDSEDLNSVVVAFASNPAFRAAEWSELTTPGNPYRRPVRPDDLQWVKYHNEMVPEKSLRLSALLGHRMLRNVYDLTVTLVPPRHDAAVEGDRADFYSDRNRVYSALARPVLERHLFSFLDGGRPELPSGTPDAAVAYVQQVADRLAAQPNEASGVIAELSAPREAAVFSLLQYQGFVPAIREALGLAAIGEFPAHADRVQTWLLTSYQHWIGTRGAYRGLLGAAGLTDTPGAYWQLLLGSSLGRGNFVKSLAANRERLPALLGAALHTHLEAHANAGLLRSALGAGFGLDADADPLAGLDIGLGWDVPSDADAIAVLVTGLLEPMVESFGAAAIDDFLRGFADAEQLRALWDRDLAAQLRWADQIELHMDYAEKVQRYLEDNEIIVDLDTFVESEEETSTTHVHNEHRLVMIEEGQMHFWSNVTHKIELRTGDKLLIPVSRLHGSTVLSGECTYHQPIISDELLAKII